MNNKILSNIKRIGYSILLILLATTPLFIVFKGELYILFEHNVNKIVIGLLGMVIVAGILSIYGVDKNITKNETDEKIKTMLEQRQPFLYKLWLIAMILTLLFTAHSAWKVYSTHNKRAQQGQATASFAPLSPCLPAC